MLLDHGVDVNSKSDSSSTPLICAVDGRQRDMVAFLIDHGADVNIADSHGGTPPVAPRSARLDVPRASGHVDQLGERTCAVAGAFSILPPVTPPGPGLSWKQLIGIPLNVLLFLLLMIMGWGSWGGFFAHPTRVGVVTLHLLMIPVMTLSTSGRSRGLKHAPDWRPFFPLLTFHSLFTAWVMPYMDARDIWVLPGGDGLRWAGLVVLTLGVTLRLGPMLELGRRFVSVVAVQEGHTLHTTGFYRLVRHPSYLGIVLMDLGFVGVFRSALGLVLMPMVFWMFKRRMDVEEAFMQEQFGSGYREYMSRTARLVPRVY